MKYEIMPIYFPYQERVIYKIKVIKKKLWGLIPRSYYISEWNEEVNNDCLKFFQSQEEALEYLKTYKE